MDGPKYKLDGEPRARGADLSSRIFRRVPERAQLITAMLENPLNAVLRRLGYDKHGMTPHGFRSMASTLLTEQQWHNNAIERQLFARAGAQESPMPDHKNVNLVPRAQWLLSQFRYKIHEANYVVR